MAILNLHHSSRPCDNSNSASDTKTLPSFTCRLYPTCMANRRRSPHRRPFTLFAGWVCYLIWYAISTGWQTPYSRVSLSQIACRLIVQKPLEPATKAKISMFCHVATEQVIGVHDVSSVYHVPLLLQSQGIVQFLQKRLNLPSVQITDAMKAHGLDLERRWKELTTR